MSINARAHTTVRTVGFSYFCCRGWARARAAIKLFYRNTYRASLINVAIDPPLAHAPPRGFFAFIQRAACTRRAFLINDDLPRGSWLSDPSDIFRILMFNRGDALKVPGG